MNKIIKFQKLLKESNLTQAIITSPNNIFYLLGYAPNQLSVSLNNNIAVLYVSTSRTVLIVMDYEEGYIRTKIPKEVEVIPYTTWTGIGSYQDFLCERELDLGESLLDILSNLITDTNIGVELGSISHHFVSHFKNVEDITKILFNMRMIKTPEEVEVFRKLCKIQTKALKEMVKKIKPGVSEKELLSIYRQSVMESNYCLPSSWTMLCSGLNSAFLSIPTEKEINEDDIIKFDGGVNLEYNYYTTDMSRSFIIGEKNKKLIDVKKILVEAQQVMIANMKPGIKVSEVFLLGYNYVKKYYPGYVRGHLGHSISYGPSTFEPPFISEKDQSILQEGMLFCVEVPMYIKDIGGMNIEDMVLITSEGNEVLTGDISHYEYEKILSDKEY